MTFLGASDRHGQLATPWLGVVLSRFIDSSRSKQTHYFWEGYSLPNAKNPYLINILEA
jgi:hypothetical protein